MHCLCICVTYCLIYGFYLTSYLQTSVAISMRATFHCYTSSLHVHVHVHVHVHAVAIAVALLYKLDLVY